jgi:hypothetical protein
MSFTAIFFYVAVMILKPSGQIQYVTTIFLTGSNLTDAAEKAVLNKSREKRY